MLYNVINCNSPRVRVLVGVPTASLDRGKSESLNLFGKVCQARKKLTQYDSASSKQTTYTHKMDGTVDNLDTSIQMQVN